MQKLALKEKSSEFSKLLESSSISNFLRKLRNSPYQGSSESEKTNAYNKDIDKLIQIIIQSKSNYDNKIQSDSDLKTISDAIGSTVYNTENISKLISEVSKIDYGSRRSFFNSDLIVEFLLFHDALLKLNLIANATITENQEEEHAIIFTLISEENPSVDLVLEVLSKLNELIEIVEKIYEEENQNNIYLLDKGSNTNIGIETGVKTAQSIFQIFKEVWDWLLNKRFYKEKIRNAAFLEKLEVLDKINEVKNNGAINEEEAARYKEIIIKRTDDLLSLNAVPRKLLIESNNSNNDQLLLGYNEIRLLKEGGSN